MHQNPIVYILKIYKWPLASSLLFLGEEGKSDPHSILSCKERAPRSARSECAFTVFGRFLRGSAFPVLLPEGGFILHAFQNLRFIETKVRPNRRGTKPSAFLKE